MCLKKPSLGWRQPRKRLEEDDLSRRFGAKRRVPRGASLKLGRIGLVDQVPDTGERGPNAGPGKDRAGL